MRSELRANAAKHLGALPGTNSIRLLQSLLDDSDLSVRVEAIRALARHGTAAKVALPKLYKMSDEEVDLRSEVTRAMNQIDR